MVRAAVTSALLCLLFGCVTPPDVVIEVGAGSDSGVVDAADAGSGDSSEQSPWLAPGETARSVLAIKSESGSAWSVGTVVAPGVFVGLMPNPAVSEMEWRDAAGREGRATVLASDRASGLIVARDSAVTATPLPLASATAGSSDRIIAHPLFASERGGWMTLRFDRTREVCNDLVDNDGDGAVDCRDGACAAWESCLPAWPEHCRDGADNDGDNEVDCEDTDCRQDLQCDALCGAAEILALPDDDGLDGAPMVDGCGTVTALVGRTQRRFTSEAHCTPSELTPTETAAPIAGDLCVSGSRPEVPIAKVRALLAEAGILPLTDGDCRADGSIPVAMQNEVRQETVSGTTLAMLRRARSMVYAGPGFSAVKVASPPLLVAPTASLPRAESSSDSLIGLDGTTLSLNSAFQRPAPLTATLSAIFYAVPTSSGFPLADRGEAVADAEYFMIGHPDTIGCGQGWAVNRIRLVAFGAGDELIFDGPGYSAGAAIVTSAGGLLAIATGCEQVANEALRPADAVSEPLRLVGSCAIIGSRVPER